MSRRVLMSLIVMVSFVCGASVAETAVFQAGVSDATGYNPAYDTQDVALSSFYEEAAYGAIDAAEIGNSSNGTDFTSEYSFLLFRFDISSIRDVVGSDDFTVTGARLILTTAGYFWDGAPGQPNPPVEPFPETTNYRLYALKAVNAAWGEGEGTEGENHNGNTGAGYGVSFQRMQIGTPALDWAVAATDGLWPPGGFYRSNPSGGNVEPDTIAMGQVVGNDFWFGGRIVLEFSDLDLLKDWAISPSANAGFLLPPPDELVGVGGTAVGNIRILLDDNSNADARPRLEIDVAELPEGKPVHSRRICTWSALGPFEPTSGDGYDEDFLGGETAVTPELGASLAGKTWTYFDDRLYCRNMDDYNDLYTFYMDGREGGPGGGTEGRVAYCGSHVWVETEQSAKILFGANDKAKVWLNGGLVHEQSTTSRAGW